MKFLNNDIEPIVKSSYTNLLRPASGIPSKQILDEKDACLHCSVRGNLNDCRNTPCNQHESWYAKQLAKEIDRLALTHANLLASLSNR